MIARRIKLNKKKKYFGGIEGGGTWFRCLIANSPDDVYKETSFRTLDSGDTLQKVANFFLEAMAEVDIEAIGVGCFGPLELREGQADYGMIEFSKMDSWTRVNLYKEFTERIGLPVYIDTDVNAAALGEFLWGAGRGLEVFVYLTIGTGIGGGAFVNGKLLHGIQHPEMGHVMIAHDLEKDPFEGGCKFHKDCWEGLASGTAVQQRWGIKGEELPPEHEAWDLEAHYLALGVSNIFLTLAPEKVILGGSVMVVPGLIEKVREKIGAISNGYIIKDKNINDLDELVTLPGLGEYSGRFGSVALAVVGGKDS